MVRPSPHWPAPGPNRFAQHAGDGDSTICANPRNPHYFIYRGASIVPLTSDHTYFAVTAADFDYIAFLDKLAANRCNFNRL